MNKTRYTAYRNSYLAEKYKPFTLHNIVKTWDSNTKLGKHILAVEELLNYACKEGYIDESDIERWSWKEKEHYYDMCCAMDMQKEDE